MVSSDESGDDESDPGSAGTCIFPFWFEEFFGCFDNSVSHVDDSIRRVRGARSGVFFKQELNKLVTLFCWLCLYQ